MSNASITSSEHEKGVAELSQELDALNALNNSLRAYLDHLRGFKKNLAYLNNNYKQLGKVNEQWIGVMKTLK